MISVPPQTASPPIKRISIKNWLTGTVSAFSDGRTPTSGLVRSGNVMLDQDGTLRQRPSLLLYGTQPLGPILGRIFEFTDTAGGTQTTSLITMQVVAGVANIYWATDGGAWTIDAAGSPVGFDITAPLHYCQVDDKVLIMNKSDPLAYFDIPTKSVVSFVALTTPTAPTLVATGLTGTTYTYYYKITANSTIGETDSSPEASQAVGTLREQWNPASQYITVTWSAVSSAQSYNVYFGVVGGDEVLLASGIAGLSFKDDGTMTKDVSRAAPVSDTTAGPIVGRGIVINDQVFLYDAADDPFLVRFGGTFNSVLDFSPFDGGGSTPIGKGTKEIPVSIQPFRTGKGDSAILVLCKGSNGTGKRYIMTPDTITSGTTVINFFDVNEDNGQTGTDSPDGVVLYNDSLWYPTTDGFKTTGTKPQLQNILSTDTVSETIITDIPRLSADHMDKSIGLANKGRIYWALPVGNTTNNEIWTLDLTRNGAWMEPWAVAADDMVLYNDNLQGGASHHLILSGNKIYEFSDQNPTSDNGTSFSTNIKAGQYAFSPDTLEWAKVIDITFIYLKPQGTFNLTVTGQGEDEAFSTVASETYTRNNSVAGWGESGWGGNPDHIFGWSNFEDVPVVAGRDQELLVIDVDEELRWISWEQDTSGAGVAFQLADVIVRYVDIGTKDLS